MKCESAKIISLSEPNQQQAISRGEVKSIDVGEMRILVNGYGFPAKVAFSCLVRPLIDDIVLITGDAQEGYFILSILERKGSQNMSLSFPADVSVNSLSGSIAIHAQDTLALNSNKATFLSRKTIHKSKQAYIDYDSMHANGTEAIVNIDTIRVLSKMLNTMAKHAISKFKSYLRHTEGADQLKAGQMTRDVRGMYSMESKYTIMVSKKDTKIDGEHIHMG